MWFDSIKYARLNRSRFILIIIFLLVQYLVAFSFLDFERADHGSLETEIISVSFVPFDTSLVASIEKDFCPSWVRTVLLHLSQHTLLTPLTHHTSRYAAFHTYLRTSTLCDIGHLRV